MKATAIFTSILLAALAAPAKCADGLMPSQTPVAAAAVRGPGASASKPVVAGNSSNLQSMGLHDVRQDFPSASGLIINCRVPVSTIGTINVGAATAVITNTSIDIISQGLPDYRQQVAPKALLRGLVLRTESNDEKDSGQRKLTGLALFLAGTMIAEIQESTPDDIIFRNEGSIAGLITGNGPTYLLIKQNDGKTIRVEADTITYVRSPRAFVFNITGTPEIGPGRAGRTDARTIVFQTTATTTGVSLSSVVHSKNELSDDEAGEESRYGIEDAKSVPAIINPTKRAFPFWP